MDKPDVDFIEGLSPAISIDQKSASRNPRSTVGTITEIYDYLRLLYARIGVPALPERRHATRAPDPQQIVDRILELPEGTRFQVLAPVVRGRKGEYDTLLEDLSGQGYVRARIDGEIDDIDEFLKRDERLARYEQHTIEIVIDRLVLREGIERRLTDSLETALHSPTASPRSRSSTRDGEAASESHVQPAPLLPGVRAPLRRAAPRTSRSTRRTGPARSATASARRSRSTPNWSSPTPSCRSTTARSRPGARAHTQYFPRMLERSPRPQIDMNSPWEKLTAKQQKVVLHGT